MKSLILLAAIAAVALAKPGTYRESEDFQYERSATGEGSKSGFYGAQRGNVGGNYERAHNMDGLAQKQLSDAVRNVQGELGDTNHVGVGNVYTAANTRGVYGRHGYDASNLGGRNFAEGSSYDANSFDSQSSQNAALSSQRAEQISSQNAAYRKGYSSYQQNARQNEFSSAGSRQNLQAANQEALDSLHSSQYGGSQGLAYTRSGYQGQGAYDYNHRSRSESQRQEQSASNSETRYVGDQRSENAYGSAAQTRLVGGGPVRISIRPGSSVTIPVAVETFDDSQRSHDANSINTDAEVIGKSGIASKSNSKGYESSYRYQKSWEKHDESPAAVPLAIPSVRPYPESYALTGSHGRNAAATEFVGGANSHSQHKGYNTASGSQSRYESAYNAQHQQAASHSNAYRGSQNLLESNAAMANAGQTNIDLGVEAVTPKSYQSKYSYHKAWERQGDPYVIVPAGGSYDSSQRLEGASQAYRSQNYNAHASHGQDVDCDC